MQQYGYWSHSPGILVAPVGGASWVGIRERKVPRGLRDTDWSIETESQSQKRSTKGREGLVGLRGVGLHTKESPDVMNPEGHAAGTSA